MMVVEESEGVPVAPLSKLKKSKLPGCIQRFKEKYLEVKPSITVHRALAFTDVTRQYR